MNYSCFAIIVACLLLAGTSRAESPKATANQNLATSKVWDFLNTRALYRIAPIGVDVSIAQKDVSHTININLKNLRPFVENFLRSDGVPIQQTADKSPDNIFAPSLQVTLETGQIDKYIVTNIKIKLSQLVKVDDGRRIMFVTLWETDDSYVDVSPDASQQRLTPLLQKLVIDYLHANEKDNKIFSLNDQTISCNQLLDKLESITPDSTRPSEP